MAGETVQSVHVNQLLSNLAVRYAPDPAGFIADIVAPRLPVNHESDIYPVFNQDDFYATTESDLVPDRGEPEFINFGHTTAQYQTHRREFAWDITDRERNNADDQLRLEVTKQTGTLGRLFLQREIRVAALLKKTTNGGQLALGAAAAQKWDATGTTYSQIMAQLMTGRTAMRQAIGVPPNILVIPAAVAEGMQKSAFFQAIQYTTTPANLISEVYPVIPPTIAGMRVLIPGTIKNTSAEGIAGSYSDIWDEQVRMLYVTSGASLDTPSVAYTFQSEPLTTRTWRTEISRKTNFATGFTVDERVVAANAGYELSDCLT